MEILKINDSKLKIMLNPDDMKKYRLSRESVDYNDAKTRKSFSEILNHVKNTHGFNTERDKVLIQFYPSKDGGSELFVTKLGVLPSASERTIARSERVTMIGARRTLYYFESLNRLTAAARMLRGIGEYKSTDVYLTDEGEYYLDLCEKTAGEGGTDIASKMLEFSRSVPPSSFAYIREHYKRLTKGNAVELFSAL